MRTLNEKEIKQLKAKQATLQEFGIPALRTVIYARKSAVDEKQTSLPTQVALCKEFIETYSFLELKRTFAEDNASGMFANNREQYQEMMALAEAGEIDVIVVMKLDRLARDMADATTAIKLLKSYGCALLAGDDIADADTPSGAFMRNIQLAQNQYHAQRVASDVMSAECNNAKNGLSAGGIPPYGLMCVDKQYFINEDEAPAIRTMFDLIAKGYSYNDVITQLTAHGYTARTGKPFCMSSLNVILRNEKYCGTFIYNRVGSKRKKNRVLNEHFDEVVNYKAIKPIISKELFDEVQTKLEKRKNVCRPKQNESNYVLTGFVTCKQCGCSISGKTQIGGRNKQKYRTYCCPNHSTKRNKTCSTKPINSDYLEFAVKSIITNSINNYLANPSFNCCFDAIKRDVVTEKVNLDKQISTLEKKVNLFLEKAVSPTTSEVLSRKYEQQAQQMIATQEQLKESLTHVTAKLEWIENTAASCKQNKDTLEIDDIFTSKEVTREIFEIFLDSITIDDANDDIQITFKTDKTSD